MDEPSSGPVYATFFRIPGLQRLQPESVLLVSRMAREQGSLSGPLWSQFSGIAVDEPVFPLFNAVAGWTVREQERKASRPAWKSYWQDLIEHPFRPSSALDDVFHLRFQIGDRGVSL